MKNYQCFLSKHFQFLEVKFSIYLNRRVFVMQASLADSLNGITNSIVDFFTRAALKSLKQKKQSFQKRSYDKLWFGPACKIATQSAFYVNLYRAVIGPSG